LKVQNLLQSFNDRPAAQLVEQIVQGLLLRRQTTDGTSLAAQKIGHRDNKKIKSFETASEGDDLDKNNDGRNCEEKDDERQQELEEKKQRQPLKRRRKLVSERRNCTNIHDSSSSSCNSTCSPPEESSTSRSSTLSTSKWISKMSDVEKTAYIHRLQARLAQAKYLQSRVHSSASSMRCQRKQQSVLRRRLYKKTKKISAEEGNPSTASSPSSLKKNLKDMKKKEKLRKQEEQENPEEEEKFTTTDVKTKIGRKGDFSTTATNKIPEDSSITVPKKKRRRMMKVE